MTKIIQEADVTIHTIAAHLQSCGLVSTSIEGNEIWYRTEGGIGYCVTILEDKKFIRLGTFLPLSKTQNRNQKLKFEHRLNQEVFLPVFALDADDDMTVTYVIPFTHGLIADQFAAMVERFASLLRFIVKSYNDDGIIDFGFSPEAGVPDESVPTTDTPLVTTVLH